MVISLDRCGKIGHARSTTNTEAECGANNKVYISMSRSNEWLVVSAPPYFKPQCKRTVGVVKSTQAGDG